MKGALARSSLMTGGVLGLRVVTQATSLALLIAHRGNTAIQSHMVVASSDDLADHLDKLLAVES